ncbi:MAG: beta-ketoacyl-ACP synthase [Myxococcales bacterium]|nr:beta-ketoacyl-ACP synthase [Myxococcales bacterium]
MYPITAYGACCGLGRSAAEAISALERGARGLRRPPFEVPFDTVSGCVPGPLDPPAPALLRHDSRLTRLVALGYADIADPVAQAVSRWGAARVAIVVGTSTGGIERTEDAHDAWARDGALPDGYDYHRQHPFHILAETVRTLSGATGPRYVVSTACSSSAKVLASARRLLDAGLADAVLVGGADGLCQTTLRGFFSLGVLAGEPCRPFAADRPGMNLGEGAAFLLLEREPSATAPARAHLLGVGETSDAYHPSSPHPEGRGAQAAMRAALAQAGLDPADIGLINAHGTGTRHNDVAESRAIDAVFGGSVPVVSTKSYTGHTLGACGALEAIFAIAALERGWSPGNLDAAPVDPDVHVAVPEGRVEGPFRFALSNAFAFGGNNTSVVLGSAS